MQDHRHQLLEDSSAINALRDTISQLHNAVDALTVSDDDKNNLVSEVRHFEEIVFDILLPEISDHDDFAA